MSFVDIDVEILERLMLMIGEKSLAIVSSPLHFVIIFW